jgi:hypothetical protein
LASQSLQIEVESSDHKHLPQEQAGVTSLNKSLPTTLSLALLYLIEQFIFLHIFALILIYTLTSVAVTRA